ncbi:MAG: GNAT family N-acetyltransferase [Clostridium sp.]|uniref:GNAT family N-acetyltransferase n=1 Tax=Clostridium sp. TaxID=1506 RepID=UPI00305B07DA
MDEIIYRKLEVNQCELIKGMNPAQYIGKAWRDVEGKRQLVDINYEDLDFPNGYGNHLNNLKKTILDGGIAIGAFDGSNKLIGFVTINREFFGEKFKYILLDQLFISLENRNKGVGKKLFIEATEEVRKWRADRIYICAGSAEETIAFYFALGCREAEEVNKELYESDTRDFQLEFVL